jgi:hypothetical protein
MLGRLMMDRSFRETVSCENYAKWVEAMEEELKSMTSNDVWDLVDILDGVKPVDYKWVYRLNVIPKGTSNDSKRGL